MSRNVKKCREMLRNVEKCREMSMEHVGEGSIDKLVLNLYRFTLILNAYTGPEQLGLAAFHFLRVSCARGFP